MFSRKLSDREANKRPFICEPKVQKSCLPKTVQFLTVTPFSTT